MNNFKIVQTRGNYPDVLLYRDRDESEQEMVKILAIGMIDGNEDMFSCEDVVFKNTISACNFISDFSLETAENWCKLNEISY